MTSRTAGKEERGWQSPVEAAAAVADLGVLVVQGGMPAIKVALDRFRKRFPKATIEIDGEPDDGGFLPDS